MNTSFFYNGRGSVELTERILALIADAVNYVKTGNFLFQDRRIVDALIEAMGRGVAVFILSNIQNPEEDSRDDTEDGHVDTHLPNLKALTRHGAHCRGLDDLHAKFILVDGMDGILMSANFSPNSIDGNIETGVLLQGDEVEDLEYVFDKLYLNADVQGILGTNEKTMFLRSKVELDSSSFARTRLTSGLRFTIVGQKKNNKKTNLSSCQVMTIYDSILEIVRHAKSELSIVTWHFKAIEMLPELLVELKSAISRGVRVRLYSNDGQENNSVDESRRCLDSLKKMGCLAMGDDMNHSKAVVSESEGIIFTANIDGKHGLKTGFEVGCVLEGERLAEMRAFVESLFV